MLHTSSVAYDAAVDGQRGRAVISEYGDDLETIDLVRGTVVRLTRNPYAGTDAILTLDEPTGRALLFYSPDNRTGYGPSVLNLVDDVTGRVVRSGIQLSKGPVTNLALAAAIVNPLTGHAIVSTADDWSYGPVHLDTVDLQTGKILRVIPIPGAPGFGGVPTLVVDTPTRHVFPANPIDKTVRMYDGTKL